MNGPVMKFNPYTGEKRRELEIINDPSGLKMMERATIPRGRDDELIVGDAVEVKFIKPFGGDEWRFANISYLEKGSLGVRFLNGECLAGEGTGGDHNL